MIKRITKFNTIVGNGPVGTHDLDAFWKQVQLQAKLILEEAQELYDAAQERNIVEVVDGSTDVWYLREYMDSLLEAAGVDVPLAKGMVCTNNDLKYTSSRQFAEISKEVYRDFDTVVCEVEFENVTYYVIKRAEDGKVMKLMDHSPPRIQDTLSPESKKTFGVE